MDAARLRLAESVTLPLSPDVSLAGNGTLWQHFLDEFSVCAWEVEEESDF